ncbi:DDE transposase [Helicobacter trogontum]|uniref:DDE transposase n=1 Tax=Helicobacter trogontum TaxID=50960 RepID=A0ABQ0D5A5_9HELI
MLHSKIMQKVVLCLVVFIHLAIAKEHIMSPLPAPEQEVMDVEIRKCSKSCLNKLYESEQFFSFASHYRPTKDKTINERYQAVAEELGIKALLPLFDSSSGLRVALMIPQKNVGRYSVTSSDAILAYLIAHGNNFSFKVFDTQNEEVNNLVASYNKISEEEYDLIISILTPRGLENLLQNADITTPLFVPTINEKQAVKFVPNKNIFFGGIDYESQVNMMVTLAEQKKSAIISFNDDSMIGKMIGAIMQSRTNTAKQEVIDSKKSTNFAPVIAKYKQGIRNSMVVLNTSVIKSGLIIPQMGNARAMPSVFLSTQINYNPSLLTLMPKEDTKKLFVVSAISPIHTRLLLFNEILSADLQYDWVNYATALALDIFLTQGNRTNIRFFMESLQGNQVMYNNRFYGVKDSHFIPVKLK